MTVRISFALILALSASMLSVECRAGVRATSGKEWNIWEKGQYSVVVGRVKEVKRIPKELDLGSHRMVLEPLALLGGTLDPSAHPALVVTFFADSDTSISDLPVEGSVVIAVIKGDDFIVSDFCLFMPHQSALVQISGLGDPEIPKTIKNLQEARAHADPDPYKPATKTADGFRK